MGFISRIIRKLGLVTDQDLTDLVDMARQDSLTLSSILSELRGLGDQKLQFALTRDVKAPVRGTSLSAGYDFFLPNDFGRDLVLEPGESALIPTGVHVSFPEDYVLIGFNKSGIAAKFKLLIGSQVIDADYQGEMHLNLHNVGKHTQAFQPGAKLTQFILLKVGLLDTEQVATVKELYGDEETDRGTGGFGSTGV